MAASKNKNKQRSGGKVFVIGIIILILIVIPLVLWGIGHNQKASYASYQEDSYTFYYPKNWTIRKQDRSDINGVEFFLQPPDAAPPETPHVTIDVAPKTQAAIDRLTAPFIIFQYTKNSSVVNGIPTQKYTNIVHSSEGVLHATAYVFQGKGNVYLVSLGYKQDVPDTQLENEFSTILSTFTLH